VALKLLAVVLPLLALHRLPRPAWHRIVWVLAWAEAAVLTTYGLVWTAGGLLAQAGVVHATTDPRALAWHAYLWDPWFLVWGLLVAAALLLSRHGRSQSHPSGGVDGGHLSVLLCPDRAEPASRISARQGRSRLLGAGRGVEAQHRVDQGDPQADDGDP
jgi:hypothetical protein